MKLTEHELYKEDVRKTAALKLPWERLQDKSILISGAGGLIGSFLVDVISERNRSGQLNCRIYALGRSRARTEARFAGRELFTFVEGDINKPIAADAADQADFVLHLASNTHPAAYAADPIGTVASNVIGTVNMLEFAAAHGAERFVFASSNEIYGENRGDVELFDESYCGYIDPNTLRAGYPESKRCGEALCQAYRKQKGIDVVIPRLTRSYGPTMLMTDTKAVSQFIRKGIAGEDIVLKSRGTQYYSFTYVADAVSGLLTVMLRGESGEAYNVAHTASDIMLADLAHLIADECGKKVVFELPDETEQAGYSVVTKARLNGEKLQRLGWRPAYSIDAGIRRTLQILKETDRAAVCR